MAPPNGSRGQAGAKGALLAFVTPSVKAFHQLSFAGEKPGRSASSWPWLGGGGVEAAVSRFPTGADLHHHVHASPRLRARSCAARKSGWAPPRKPGSRE